eukprot:4999133-Pyramimonas_sp.AAC.1
MARGAVGAAADALVEGVRKARLRHQKLRSTIHTDMKMMSAIPMSYVLGPIDISPVRALV